MARLILIDDNPTVQQVVQMAFHGEAIQVRCLDDPELGLEHLRRNGAEVALVDASLTSPDSLEWCRLLGRDPLTRHVQIVMMTGPFQQFDEGRAREAGCAAHLQKPLETDQLVELVMRLAAEATRLASWQAAGGWLIPLGRAQCRPLAPLSRRLYFPGPARTFTRDC